MEYEWLIIDGYNLLHRDEGFGARHGDFATARQRLVRGIEGAALEMAPKVTVVFDGREAGMDASLSAARLEVVFSPAGTTADGVIEGLVARAERPERIGVVTSDRVEEQIVSSAGASVISCEAFLQRCKAARQRPPISAAGRFSGSAIGDFFPENGR